MNSQMIPAGKTQCYVSKYTMKIYVKDGVAAKVIVPLKIDVGGEHLDHADFMPIDPENKTSKNKSRSDYTIANMKTLGALDPASDLADALEAGVSEVTFKWGERAWIPCEVKHNGGFTNVYYGEGMEVNASKAKKAAAHFRKGGGGASSPPANPFAPVGKPVQAPPPRAQAPAQKEHDTSFDFGVNADADAEHA
jgi:hypothetical protein